MDANLFLQQFGHLAQGKGGIKKLRDVILQLAVQGKLVEQNPADEPAEVLLKRIEEEKKQLIKERRIKSIKVEDLTKKECPYPLPSTWQWSRLGNLATVITDGTHHTPHYIDSGIPFISVKDIDGKSISLKNCKYISIEQHEEINQRCNPKVGDLLICRIGTLGRVTIVDTEKPFSLFVSVGLLKFIQTKYIPRFAHLVMHSPLLTKQYQKIKAGGSHTNKLNLADLPKLLLPVAPLAEQKRIVAKVDELMALCDKLEAEQKTQRALKTQAVQSTLHHLTNAENRATFGTGLNILEHTFGNWFDDLATVKHLRATILQLAVQGKLVPQNPTDEPAKKLVSRINKKQYQFKPTETPFLLPHGWAWASFPQLGEFGRGKSKHRPRNDPRLYTGGKYPFVQTGDVSRAKDYIRTYSATYNDEGLAQSKMWPTGTMCITIAANIAETAILDFDACFPDSVVGFVPAEEIGNVRYFEYFLRTAKTRLEDFAPATAQKNINLGILEQVAIPLPPSAELKRIVAKVDELMVLCDQLEAQITKSQTLNTHLMDSLIHQMAEAV